MKLLKLVAELAETDAQQLRCASLHAAHALQRELHVAMLDAIEHRFQIDAFGWKFQRYVMAVAGLAEARRQPVWLQQFAGSQHHRALDDVFQFPDVARPVVLLEHG